MLSRWPRRCRQSIGLSPPSPVGPWLCVCGDADPSNQLGDGGHSVGFLSHGAGENVRDFFFRVAALTFESSVLAELERSSARRIGDTVREYPLQHHSGVPIAPSLCWHPPLSPSQHPPPAPLGISSNESDLYLSAPRKKPKCCQ